MSRIFEDNSQSIGNTPLVKLNRLTVGIKAVAVLGKIEGRNRLTRSNAASALP